MEFVRLNERRLYRQTNTDEKATNMVIQKIDNENSRLEISTRTIIPYEIEIRLNDCCL